MIKRYGAGIADQLMIRLFQKFSLKKTLNAFFLKQRFSVDGGDLSGATKPILMKF